MGDSTKMESTQPTLHVKYPGQDAPTPPKAPSRTPSISQRKASVSAAPQVKGVLQADAARREQDEASEDPSNLVSPPKKPGLTSRLSKMFVSQTKTGAQSSTAASRPESSVSQATTAVSDRASESAGSSRAPSISSAGQSSHPPSRTPSHTGRQSSKERELAAPPMERRNSKTPAVQSVRFQVTEDGHTHTLKSAKRQEKLSDMLRDAFGAKRKDGNDQYQQLSLMSTWVDNLKSEKDKLAADKKGGPNQTETLVQKYGKCQEIVGRGAFGIVRISHKPVGTGEQLYAVKEFRRRPSESAKKYQKRLTSEFCISSSLRHPNVIHTLDLLEDAKGDLCEVMEFCAGGDLYTLVLAAGKLEVAEADCFFKQLMRGVEYLHEMGVAHRDLKPENLLLTCRGALKITDFGNGECFRMAWEKDAHMTSGMCGSGPYIAPEEYCENEFDPRAVDIWATGVIYMAMRTGRHLWHEASKDDEFFANYLVDRKSEDGFKPIEVLKRAKCRNVIYSILDPNPTRRITASQVLKSEWGRGIKICTAGEEGL